MSTAILAITHEHEWIIPTTVIFIYLAVVLYIGIFAFRKGKSTGEDFFLASRSIGPIVFFLSLFATNMTAFAIIGSSGASYRQGIGIFGMMASSSGLVIPLTLFVIGTRLWALGERFGHMTQVAYFRDRWECSSIGTIIFLLTSAMLIPYLIISIVGGGTILEALTDGKISYPVGGAIVALVVMGNVFFGGMRGAVWVNIFQTLLFLCFGMIAFIAIDRNMPGGLRAAVESIANNPNTRVREVLTRDRIPTTTFFSYMFIPLSAIMFPHMAIMCLTARKVTAFRKTVVLYPLCIMAIWLPCVFLGALGTDQPPVKKALATESEEFVEWIEQSDGKKALDPAKAAPRLVNSLKVSKDPQAKVLLADADAHNLGTAQDVMKRLDGIKDPAVKGEIARLSALNSDSVLLKMLRLHVPPLLAGILAAGIISAVMGSDCHQILALSTMFTKDIFDYYGGRKRFGERGTIFVGRTFIVLANLVAYLIALGKPNIFELAISYAFSGFASLAPIMLAAMFWKRSTKYGALAATLFVGACVMTVGILERTYSPLPTALPAASEIPIWTVGGKTILYLTKVGRLSIYGFMPVVPMVIGSGLCVTLFSLITRTPSAATLTRYFPSKSTLQPAQTPVVA